MITKKDPNRKECPRRGTGEMKDNEGKMHQI